MFAGSSFWEDVKGKPTTDKSRPASGSIMLCGSVSSFMFGVNVTSVLTRGWVSLIFYQQNREQTMK